MRIMSWNKNDCNIENRMDDIKELTRRHKPHIIIIQELNLSNNNCKGIINMEGYQFEHDDLINSNKTSRCGMWVSDKLTYSRNKKLEAKDESVIAIRVGFPNRNKFNCI